MSNNSPEDKLLTQACLKLKKIINARGQKGVCLDAFVIRCNRHNYAVRVSQVAQKPDVVFHVTVYNEYGVFKTASMVTGSMLHELSDVAKKSRTRKPSTSAVPG